MYICFKMLVSMDYVGGGIKSELKNLLTIRAERDFETIKTVSLIV